MAQSPEEQKIVKQWHDDPPLRPGVYLWRRKRLWEPIEREVTGDRRIFSHRFEQMVSLEKLGGQWYY